MLETLATPALVIDEAVLRRNVRRLAEYARSHKLNVRPHTKTHKSLKIARMQLAAGAIGLTVAKAGEALVMAQSEADILVAYPSVDRVRCETIAGLAKRANVSVALDSLEAANALSAAAFTAGSTVGVLVDLDVGMHRTGVQSPAEAVKLIEDLQSLKGLRWDGLFFYPGHIGSRGDEQKLALQSVDAKLSEALALLTKKGLQAKIVSGGSTPTAYASHHVKAQTEIRPGTYVFNDMNCVHGGFVTLEDCAAKIVCTVVSTAVPGQVVIDAGTKTLTSDKCGPAPDSGHGLIVEYTRAKIVKLTEEHGQVDITGCDSPPLLGERITIVPNHICPCINLQDNVWLLTEQQKLEALRVDARGLIQ